MVKKGTSTEKKSFIITIIIDIIVIIINMLQ